MKKSKKGLIIGIAIIAVLAIAVVAGFLFAGKMANQSSYTVKFELCTELQTTTVLDRTVAPGSFLEEPEVYVTESNEENWAISGWYREPEYETQWDFDFDTVESDLTLYAKWETNPQCTVNYYTLESEKPVVTTVVRKGLVVTPRDEEFVGREVFGYYSDKEMTKEFDFKTKIEEDTNIYVDISEYVYFNAKMMSKWSICGNQTEVDNYEVSVSLSQDEELLTVTSKNGGYLWLKNLALNMNGTSIIEIKAREVNDKYSGSLNGYIFGDYTLNGEPGGSGDFGQPNTGALRYARSAKPDEDGFYTYTYNISNLTPGLIYTEMNGIRIGFTSTDKHTYEIKEVKTRVDEYAVSGEAFSAKSIHFTGLHLNTFTLMENAETQMLENGDLRFGGPNGAYLYKKGLSITLGEEQIVRLKAKGDLKGGTIVLYYFGEYTQDGKKLVSTDFSAEQRINFIPGEKDASGYVTYTADFSSIPGLKVNTVHGLRIGLHGQGNRSIDMQSLKSYVPTAEEKEIAKGFVTDGLNLNGSHFTTFLKMGDAEGTLLDNGNYKFSGPYGAYIYKKNVEIALGDAQKIELKAKGDLKGGRIRLFLYGEYTQDGKAGTTTDYNESQKWDLVAEGTDADGYTTYSVNLDSTNGLKFNTIHGLRLDLYGEGTRTIEIASLKSVIPTEEEKEVIDSFAGKGINFTGAHLMKFTTGGKAEKNLLDNGDCSFSGPHAAMIYYKGMEITLDDDQIIEIKAKGDLKDGRIRLFLYGEYTKNGTAGTTTDYNAEHQWDFRVGETDAEGYTTYTIEINSIAGLKFDTVHGFRLDMYGDGTRTLEIKSVKSVAPSKEDITVNDGFTANGLNLTGAHFNKFLKSANATTELLDNGDLKLSGGNDSYIYKKELAIILEEDQTIQLKTKADLKGGRIDVYMYGDYTQDGVAGTTTNYGTHRWMLTSSTTDADGYRIYTFNIGDIEGLTYQTIRGLRVGLVGNGGEMSLEIQSLKSMVPELPSDIAVNYYVGSESIYSTTVKAGEKALRPADNLITMGHKILGYYSDEACETAYDFGSGVTEETNIYVKLSDYLYFSPEMLNQFNIIAGSNGSSSVATKKIAEDGTLEFEAVDGSFIHKKELNIDVTDTQVLKLATSASVNVRQIQVWLFGTYMKDGTEQQVTDYNTNFRWLITPDTSGEIETYTLDLSESDKTDGMTWLTIDGIRVDIRVSDTNTGILDIQSIEATKATKVLKEDFESAATWTYTGTSTGTVPAQVTENMTLPNVIASDDCETTSGSKWSAYDSTGTFSFTVDPKDSANKVVSFTHTADGGGIKYRNDGIFETGKTYTISFDYYGAARMHLYTLGLKRNAYVIADDWLAPSDGKWTSYSIDIDVTDEDPATAQILWFKMATTMGGTFYIDNLKITCGTTEQTKYTQGVGTCIQTGVATEEDNVLYITDYDSVSTAVDIKAGTTYKYTFLMRTDATGSDFDFDVHVGGTKVADVVSGALTAGTWTEINGTFVATADATSFGFLRAGEGGVYIDDIVLEKAQAGEVEGGGTGGGEQVENTTGLVQYGDFENAGYTYTTDWRVQGTTGSMAIVADPDNAANKVLSFTSTDANSGVDYNAGFARGFLEKDKTYTISFKYKGEARFHVYTLGLLSAGHTIYDDWLPPSANGWTTYSFDITPSYDTTTTSMQIYLKMATATGGTFYIDDFSIVEKTQ